MTTAVRRFEDLIAWQKARALTRAIYLASREGAFARDFELSRQIRRAAISIMSNLAEGFERHSTAEFHQFVVTAKGSCAECRSQLYVARDAGHLSAEQFSSLFAQAEEVGRVVGGLRASIARRRNVAK
ncbi:MAG: four helix bundle protein [Deltaproteobacteria bacterium]|nr:four helix bundle protein [Deltaproteobacteria bacterium]